MDARDPLAEARALAGPEAWVLEPSPPAVADEPWFADDPTTAGGLDWHAWLAANPAHADWAADRWLGAYRRLPPTVPASLVETRLVMHQLAVDVVSPARQRANGKIGLRWTLGGFGTPFFGDDEQLRVEGAWLVRQRAGSAEAEPLDVDPAAAAFLAAWYGFATSVLEALRSDHATDPNGPSRVQLWPEHFDLAFTAAATTFGASPGDADSPEPYLYVLPPDGTPPDDTWNATSFTGAILPFSAFTGAADQRAAALEFFRSCAPPLS